MTEPTKTTFAWLVDMHASLPGSWGLIGFRRHDDRPAAIEHGFG
jgi:hypothetical protein